MLETTTGANMTAQHKDDYRPKTVERRRSFVEMMDAHAASTLDQNCRELAHDPQTGTAPCTCTKIWTERRQVDNHSGSIPTLRSSLAAHAFLRLLARATRSGGFITAAAPVHIW